MYRRSICMFSSAVYDELKGLIQAKYQEDLAKINYLKKDVGDTNLSDATIAKAYGGMRGIAGLVYEPSLLDVEEGIRFRGLSIPECQAQLPKADVGMQMVPEGMLWLLMTGSVPTKEQAKALNAELQQRGNHESVAAAKKVLDVLPQDIHPLSQYTMGVMQLQHYSKFAAAYAAGKANKSNYWELALDDSLDCIARSPQIAAMIYRRMKTGKSDVVPINSKLDFSANFARQMGFSDPLFDDALRLYLSIHTDHEGGNVSAHTTTLVASALSDPYLAFAAGLNGLAGPLHGLANQEVLVYLFEMKHKCEAAGVDFKNQAELEKTLEKFTWELLNQKRVVPGYGHAVLRKTDPRYTCQREFCTQNFPNDELFILVNTIYKIMPGILTKHGKTKNPYPNVDAHSGVVLQHYGMTETHYYTVMFGVARQIGALTGVVWDRLQGRPIERPKSFTTEYLWKKYGKK